jgi:GNAT superfamily N-acetyltransferase
MRLLACATAAEIERAYTSAPVPPTLPRLNPADFAAQRADLHLCALSKDGRIAARCSLWWTHVPSYQHHRVGVVGHYAAASDESSVAILAAAEEPLRIAGCTIAIGPMNGNTWRSYRFVVDAGERAPFFLEPTNPQEWPAQFERRGFSSLASYFSSLNADLSQSDPRLAAMEKSIADAGVTIRTAHSDLRSELKNIYAVSQISFRQNFLYTEIPESEFMAMYEPILPVARPELVLLAERAGHCIGYLFAIPDLAQQARGLAIDTFIIKTVAVLPMPDIRGLGTLLVARAQQAGHQLGFRHCIHALMFEDNISRKISSHYASVMRKYALFAKVLSA